MPATLYDFRYLVIKGYCLIIVLVIAFNIMGSGSHSYCFDSHTSLKHYISENLGRNPSLYEPPMKYCTFLFQIKSSLITGRVNDEVYLFFCCIHDINLGGRIRFLGYGFRFWCLEMLSRNPI